MSCLYCKSVARSSEILDLGLVASVKENSAVEVILPAVLAESYCEIVRHSLHLVCGSSISDVLEHGLSAVNGNLKKESVHD